MTFLGAMAVCGIVFLCWEVQGFLRNSLSMKWQEIHTLERIRQELQNIEMSIRGQQK